MPIEPAPPPAATAVRPATAGGGWTPERFNRVTHWAGFAGAIPAVAVLVAAAARGGDRWRVVGCAIYGAALLGVYAASALSHGSENDPRRRRAFRVADQALIFTLIAGTFTPFALAYRGVGTLAVLGLMWALAAAGVARRVRRGGDQVAAGDVAFCVLIGWLPVLVLPVILAVGGPVGFGLILAGGVLYTAGTPFLLNDGRNPWLHGVWHLFTVAGSAAHYAFLLGWAT